MTTNQDEHSSDDRILEQLRRRMTVIGVATGGLFVLAFLVALDAASVFLIPIILAHLLDRLLSPLVRAGEQMGVPDPVGAAIVLVLFLGMLGAGGYYLSGPAMEWMESAPRKLRIAQYKLQGVTEPVEKIKEAAKEVEKATGGDTEGQQEVQVQESESLQSMLVSRTTTFVSGLLITIFLLYFLLASGDLLVRKVVRVLPVLHQKKNAVRIIGSIERELSRYLGMIFLINVGLGVAVGAAMYLIGMPNPMLWGALAGILNFIPYLGPAVNITVVGLVAFVSFQGVGYAILAPLSYLVLNGLEASLVTPAVIGWRLQLNPVVIFIALTFWAWIWGIIGALLAIPLLASIKITCDRIEVLQPVGELLGQ